MNLRSFFVPSCFSLLLLSVPCSAKMEWIKDPNPAYTNLYKNGKQIGTYQHSTQEYFSYDEGTHTFTGPLPIPSLKEEENFGVYREDSKQEKWTVDGRAVSQESGLKVIAGDVIPDDSKLPWLVYVGDATTGSKIEADLQVNKDTQGKYRFQFYQVGEFGATDRDGKTCYAPGITCVSANRVAIWHLTSYTSVEDLVNYVRKLPPDYDPSKVPELENISSEAPLTSTVPITSFSLLSLLSGIVLLKRKS